MQNSGLRNTISVILTETVFSKQFPDIDNWSAKLVSYFGPDMNDWLIYDDKDEIKAIYDEREGQIIRAVRKAPNTIYQVQFEPRPSGQADTLEQAVRYVFLKTQKPKSLIKRMFSSIISEEEDNYKNGDRIVIPDLEGWSAKRVIPIDPFAKRWKIYIGPLETDMVGMIWDNGELVYFNKRSPDKSSEVEKENKPKFINDPIQVAKYIYLKTQEQNNPTSLAEELRTSKTTGALGRIIPTTQVSNAKFGQFIKIKELPGWTAERIRGSLITSGWRIDDETGKLAGTIWDDGTISVQKFSKYVGHETRKHYEHGRDDLANNPVQAAKYIYLKTQEPTTTIDTEGTSALSEDVSIDKTIARYPTLNTRVQEERRGGQLLGYGFNRLDQDAEGPRFAYLSLQWVSNKVVGAELIFFKKYSEHTDDEDATRFFKEKNNGKVDYTKLNLKQIVKYVWLKTQKQKQVKEDAMPNAEQQTKVGQQAITLPEIDNWYIRKKKTGEEIELYAENGFRVGELVKRSSPIGAAIVFYDFNGINGYHLYQAEDIGADGWDSLDFVKQVARYVYLKTQQSSASIHKEEITTIQEGAQAAKVVAKFPSLDMKVVEEIRDGHIHGWRFIHTSGYSFGFLQLRRDMMFKKIYKVTLFLYYNQSSALDGYPSEDATRFFTEKKNGNIDYTKPNIRQVAKYVWLKTQKPMSVQK